MNLNHILSIVIITIIILSIIIVIGGIICIILFKRYSQKINALEDKTINVLKRVDQVSYIIDEMTGELEKMVNTFTTVLIGFIKDIDSLLKFANKGISLMKPLVRVASTFGSIGHKVVNGIESVGSTIVGWFS